MRAAAILCERAKSLCLSPKRLHAVFDLHEGALEETNDVASFVGLFEDYLFELWVGSYLRHLGQFSISNYELSVIVAHVSSVRTHRIHAFC